MVYKAIEFSLLQSIPCIYLYFKLRVVRIMMQTGDLCRGKSISKSQCQGSLRKGKLTLSIYISRVFPKSEKIIFSSVMQSFTMTYTGSDLQNVTSANTQSSGETQQNSAPDSAFAGEGTVGPHSVDAIIICIR